MNVKANIKSKKIKIFRCRDLVIIKLQIIKDEYLHDLR